MGLLSEGALEVVDKSRQVNVFIDPQKAVNNVRIFGLHFNPQENCFQYSLLYDPHFRCYETSYCNPKSLPKKTRLGRKDSRMPFLLLRVKR